VLLLEGPHPEGSVELGRQSCVMMFASIERVLAGTFQ